jgi:FkbM family methyltransferase
MILNLHELSKKYELKIDGVIHIGAHFGEEHETYKSMGIDKIVYFEPVKKTFEVLKERIVGAELYNLALGNKNDFLEMYVEDEDKFGCSSLLEPSDNYNGHATFSKKELVEVKTLDFFNFTGYNFLNIDVQGYEYEVLEGSIETLKKVDYIMCEINRNTTEKKLDYINAKTVDKLTNFLNNFGFVLVEENWAGISWGDGFYIKK